MLKNGVKKMVDPKLVIKYLTILELSLDKEISKELIQKQYRNLSKLYHPDTSPDAFKDGQKFLLLKEATDYLLLNIEEVNYIIANNFSSTISFNDSKEPSDGDETNNYDEDCFSRTNDNETTKKKTKVSIKFNKKVIMVVGAIGVLVIFLVYLLMNTIIPSIKYSKAQDLYDDGDLAGAIKIYLELDNYKDSKNKISEIQRELERQNWIEYKGMTIKLPSGSQNKARVENGKIYISKDFDLSINDFLECVKAPEGKSFYAKSNFANSNGTKSFLIKNCRSGQGQYYSNQNSNQWTNEYFDLLFCGYSTLDAIYVGQNGNAPQYIHGNANSQALTISIQNGWHEEMFEKEVTTIIGQYHDSATKSNSVTFEIVVVKE